jgi:D-alanyl-D-alanine carboxypeptidase/D-alanyl-D-alanine-endopeptidase (penicillin-binding protein 4)
VRRVFGVVGVLVLVVGGYVTADVFDLVPGLLTLAPAPATAGIATPPPATTEGAGQASPGTAAEVPIPSAAAHPAAPLVAAEGTGPLPTRARLAAALAVALADPGLGRSVGLTVRDATTGAHLLDVSAQVPRVPASTAKLLTATAVMATMTPARTFSTLAVRGSSSRDLVLVAGGDTLLSPGRGTPAAVAGRAGLADLAQQAATALRAQGVSSVRLHLDDVYALGPPYAPHWVAADINAGLTGAVAMLGLSTQRAVPNRPGPPDPALSAAGAFRRALAADGIAVAPAIDRAAAPRGSPVLGTVESAPVADVLALALESSDNALTESLARQGAAQAGRGTSFSSVAAWVSRTVAARGVAMTGVTLVDASGLSAGTLMPVRALGDVLSLAAGGRDPALRQVIAALPVAGLSGTLADRFLKGSVRAAAGVVRAKTGTLTGTSALAGTVVDRDGRLLTFAILADRVRPGVGTLTARAALDRFVATLASCGCG